MNTEQTNKMINEMLEETFIMGFEQGYEYRNNIPLPEKEKKELKKLIRKTMKKEKEYLPMCGECGTKKYKRVNDLDGVTVSIGICPVCKKEKGIVPSSDWEYYEGNNLMWD